MTIRLPALLQDQHTLRTGFEFAVRSAMAAAVHRSTKGKPQEPDFVAMLMVEGVPMISATLREIASRHGITSRVSSVFCHQRPLVQFNRGMDTCELGDILIVHRHTDWHGGVMRNNALLLQAKMYDKAPYKIPYQEQHQLRLYQKWPTFTYVRSSEQLNGLQRSVSPKARHSGAQYLLIDGANIHAKASASVFGHLGSPCMSVWPAEETLSPHFGLADELIRLMVGVTGRPFEDRADKDPTGWSTVVWDLLEHSVEHVFTRRNIKAHRISRFGGDAMASDLDGAQCFFDSDAHLPNPANSVKDNLLSLRDKWQRDAARRGDVPPPDRNIEEKDWNDTGGVSLVVIETQQDRDNRGTQ